MVALSRRPSLEIYNVCKRLGNQEILRGASINLWPGSIHALLGPNGSGKTTLMKVAAGIFKPDSGKVFLNGINLNRNDKIKRSIATVFQRTLFDQSDKVIEALKLYAKVISADVSKAFDALKEAGLQGQEEKKVFELSEGNKKRLELSKLLISEGDILLLDEPFEGLDADGKLWALNLLRRAKQEGKSMLLITHDVEEVLEMADEVTLIFNGKTLHVGKLDKFKEELDKVSPEGATIRLKVSSWSSYVEKSLKDVEGIISVNAFPDLKNYYRI